MTENVTWHILQFTIKLATLCMCSFIENTYPMHNMLKAVQLHRLVAVRHCKDTLRQNNVSNTISKHLKEWDDILIILRINILLNYKSMYKPFCWSQKCPQFAKGKRERWPGASVYSEWSLPGKKEMKHIR